MTTPVGQPPAPSSQPPWTEAGGRTASLSDVNSAPALPTGYTLADMIIANTDPSLTTTDTRRDSEPSLAVNGSNANQLAAYSFSSSWGQGNAAIWYSINGGTSWTKEYTMSPPTGIAVASGCPCDVTLDYDRGSRLFGTTLNEVGSGNTSSGDVYSGDSTNPAIAAWSWYAPGGIAQQTDQANSGADDADQPWLRINRDPFAAGQDNAYVAYDDFSAGAVHVAVAPGSVPPNFTRDAVSGAIGCCVNPGARLAVDHSNGTVYLAWQYGTGINPDGSRAVSYALTRSTDGGITWGLNGSGGGLIVANANSDQISPKFGGVNALRGGVDAISVDPSNSDVYIVYGSKDAANANRLAIRRLTSNGSGGLAIGSEHFVTGQVQAALPAVAVASNGAIGVLYDTYDGNDASGFAVFTVHLAQSGDHGVFFSDVPLVTFHSPELSDPNDTQSLQRILGDFQQLRSLGTTFYGVFPANGAAFGRPLANIDPVLVTAPANAMANVPAAPTNVNASPGNASASVSWTPPASNGGTAITNYLVTPLIGTTAQASTTVGNVASTTIAGLTNGTTYAFKVAAVNAIGTGPQSPASNPVTPRSDQTITVAAGAPAGAAYGSSFTVAATAPGGAITHSSSGVCTNSGAAFTMTSGTGICTVKYDQAGSAGYYAAPPVTQSVTAQKANQTITFAALPDKKSGDADFAVSAKASSGLSVSFTASGSCTVTGATVHIARVGLCKVTASQAGDANFNAAPDVAETFAITALTPPTRCVVPRVVGKRLATAKLLLKRRHCRTGRVTHAASRRAKRGVVTSQSRRPGRVLPANAKINLVVGRGPRR